MFKTLTTLFILICAFSVGEAQVKISGQTIISGRVTIRDGQAAAAAACSTSVINYNGAQNGTISLDAGGASNYRLATQFVPSASGSACTITVYVSGAMTGSSVAEIWSSSGPGTAPSALLGTASSTVSTTTYPGSEGTVSYSGTLAATLVSGTTYHVVINLVSGGGNFSGNGLWYYNAASASSLAYSMSLKDNASAWVDINAGAAASRFKVQVLVQ